MGHATGAPILCQSGETKLAVKRAVRLLVYADAAEQGKNVPNDESLRLTN